MWKALGALAGIGGDQNEVVAGFEKKRFVAKRLRNGLLLVVVGVIIGATGAEAYENWTAIGEAVGPSCTVGLTGMHTQLSVQGWTSLDVCNQLGQVPLIQHQRSNGGGGGASVCQYEWRGNKFTMHDTSANLIDKGFCISLRQAATLNALVRTLPRAFPGEAP